MAEVGEIYCWMGGRECFIVCCKVLTMGARGGRNQCVWCMCYVAYGWEGKFRVNHGIERVVKVGGKEGFVASSRWVPQSVGGGGFGGLHSQQWAAREWSEGGGMGYYMLPSVVRFYHVCGKGEGHCSLPYYVVM